MQNRATNKQMVGVTMLGGIGCVCIAFTAMVLALGIDFGITKLIQWGFHTQFAPTFVAVVITGIILSSFTAASRGSN